MDQDRHTSQASPDTDHLPDDVLAEQVRQIYALAPIGIVATLINSVIVFFIMKGVMPAGMLIAWLAAVFSVAMVRVGYLMRFRSMRLQPVEANTWGNRFIIGLALSGITWGSIGILPFAEISPAHEVFLAFVLGGMAAGAAATFSVLKQAYLAFSVPALAPLTIRFFIAGDPLHYAMGAMFFLFGLLLWRLSLYNYYLGRTSLLLTFENKGMIDRLHSAKENAERLNRKLLAEISAKLKAETELRAYQENLERVVAERTNDLVRANQQLKAEIEERKQTERALRQSEESLQSAQEKLRAAKDAAEAASLAKSEFLANMSHEIRTPLAGAQGMLNLVLEMEIGGEERQLLEMAKRSTDSLLRLITDLLDFSRLEAGIIQLERKSFAVQGLIKTAVEVVSIAAREKGLRLSWAVEESVPDTMEGDEGRLRQVLVNLVGNSIKFTKEGEVEVTARLFTDPEMLGKRSVLFSVRDTGIGIPPDHIERIFGKFIQVDASTTRKFGGTGLGLALSRQIVETMGGRIWAESRVGAGSTFFFTFPLE